MNIFDKFSLNLTRCLSQASEIAAQSKQSQVTIDNFLTAVLSEKSSLTFNFTELKTAHREKSKYHKLDSLVAKKTSLATITLSKNLTNLLTKAALLAHKQRHFYIGIEHCLAIILNDPKFTIAKNLESHGVELKKLKLQIDALLRGNSKFPEFANYFQNPSESNSFDDYPVPTRNPLDHFSVNLTDAKLQETINPIVKRESEIDRLIQILCRKDKNNPLILGDPGVGKTALVEGLAKKIVNREVPNILLNKKILSLDLGLIVAGTMYRGDFEQRLKSILDEVKKNPNIILFIDELHNIIGAGSSSGSLDAANLLKPLLARGDLRLIGATTLEEYKKFIEKDGALERRFQPIILGEPTTEEALDILHGIKDNYQNFHQVVFSDEALEAAVNLSRRYISDKFLPDKAIDLIDEAAAKIKIKNFDTEIFKELRKLEFDLKNVKNEKNCAIIEEKFNLALKLKQKEKDLTAKITEITDANQTNRAWPRVEREQILEIVSQKTKIPLNDLNSVAAGFPEMILKLKEKIIGQDQVIEKLAKILTRAKLGLNDENRPLASMMFLGPSGVGKTYLAQNLAQAIFKDKDALIRIDMSEYAEKFNATKLLGAPAGYVGYREGGSLTDAVKRRPYSLILFDEIDKAHPEILNLLLQILEDGQITDAVGKKINFKNTVIIMTSNFGAETIFRQGAIGFGDDKNQNAWQEKILADIKKIYKPEFLNRIDAFLLFEELKKAHLEKIIILELEKLKQKLLRKKIKLTVAKEKISDLARKSVAVDHGARGVRKVIIEEIENLIAQKMLNQQPKNITLK